MLTTETSGKATSYAQRLAWNIFFNTVRTWPADKRQSTRHVAQLCRALGLVVASREDDDASIFADAQPHMTKKPFVNQRQMFNV